jgi:hypothetical protein
MVAVDLPLRLRDGQVTRLDAPDGRGLLGIRGIADELHTSARRLRLFVVEPVDVDEVAVRRLASRSAAEVAGILEAGGALL